MYSPPPAQRAPYPRQPAQRWWRRPAVIITALVLLPPLGIALAWMTRWTQGRKIVATALSGVCFQSPEAGAAPADATLHLVAPGKTCPAATGTRLRAEVTQAPAPSPSQKDADGTSGTGGGGSTHYKNCDAAKAAGAAPIRKGQPGYRSALDKDGDGIACDK
ncbi:excalibur calcium-binding domain-containing protein [Streptomyces xanthophaeus]|uniref:excalibur calcium-binding domain-containing protein n=1 Tax=Streptomyces xanthophaeus TaxID=67385 RepID=UPI00341CC9BA